MSSYRAFSRSGWSFSAKLDNRVVNLVPVSDITRVPQWVDDSTQTIGIYPDSLRVKLRDDSALHGAQRTLPLGETLFDMSAGAARSITAQTAALPHDGMEPMRRMVKSGHRSVRAVKERARQWNIGNSEAVGCGFRVSRSAR